MGKALSRLWQTVWGFPQTLIGLLLFLGLWRGRHHGTYRTAYITEWGIDAGFSLGMFIFVPRNSSKRLMLHEYGHTLQSMILGPFYLPLIVVPSLVWAGVPYLQRYRSVHQFSYYRFYTERWANRLCHRVTGENPIGWDMH